MLRWSGSEGLKFGIRQIDKGEISDPALDEVLTAMEIAPQNSFPDNHRWFVTDVTFSVFHWT